MTLANGEGEGYVCVSPTPSIRMDDPIYVGFTSYCNEYWISFGSPYTESMGGHEIRWRAFEEEQLFLHTNEIAHTIIKLRERIIIRTGHAPDVKATSLNRMLLTLVQLTLEDNLI
jgi:hypothetical protein